MVHRSDLTEPLIERVARQLTTEAAIVFLQQGAQQRAAQGPARALLELPLFHGGQLLRWRSRPSVQGALDKVPLRATRAQAAIDLLQAPLESQVVHIADDGRQLRAQFLGKGNALTGHSASLYPSLQYVSKTVSAPQRTAVAYLLRVQAIRSRGQNPRLNVSFPLALAAAIALEPGETVQWELLDRGELRRRRPNAPPPAAQSRAHAAQGLITPRFGHPPGNRPRFQTAGT